LAGRRSPRDPPLVSRIHLLLAKGIANGHSARDSHPEVVYGVGGTMQVRAAGTKNKYCRSSDLSNEASVESFFVLRMLLDLGYRDSEIKTKHSIGELPIPKGSLTERFKPDFILVCGRQPRWLIDAKATWERIEQYTYQCAGYALQINRRHKQR